MIARRFAQGFKSGRVARWLMSLALGPRVSPAFVAECDRARLEHLSGRDLGPSVPVDPDPVEIPVEFASQHEYDRRFWQVVAAVLPDVGEDA